MEETFVHRRVPSSWLVQLRKAGAKMDQTQPLKDTNVKENHFLWKDASTEGVDLRVATGRQSLGIRGGS